LTAVGRPRADVRGGRLLAATAISQPNQTAVPACCSLIRLAAALC